jgi:3-hydroxymyristoyl/3-hydroxydecanoyl-(acyl carrier protein) dehydratase
MIDRIDSYLRDGGPKELGLIQGTKSVSPDEWFFKAHFHQDPVWPGSLGLESFLQLLRFIANELWPKAGNGESSMFGLFPVKHSWTYRGQVLPSEREVSVQAVVTRIDNERRMLQADGYLSLRERVIYHMKDFAVGWSRKFR